MGIAVNLTPAQKHPVGPVWEKNGGERSAFGGQSREFASFRHSAGNRRCLVLSFPIHSRHVANRLPLGWE